MLLTKDDVENTLRGVRCWNVKDPAFVGLVVLTDILNSHNVLHAVKKLDLAPVRLVNWSACKIVYMNGAEIRVRVVPHISHARRHQGQVYWTICYLQRVPDDVYTLMNLLVRPPATHEPRFPGVRSRFAQKQFRERTERLRESARQAESLWGKAPRTDTWAPVIAENIRIEDRSGDGLLLWTNPAGDVCVLPREAINADYKRTPPETWDHMVNYFLAMNATLLGETQTKFQKQLDYVQTQISALTARLDTQRDVMFKQDAKLEALEEAHRKQVGLLHKRISLRKDEIASLEAAI